MTDTASNPPIYSVSQLNRLARQSLEQQFPLIRVEGEISNLSRPSSGHWYFTLKDNDAQVRCAMFKNRNFRLRWQPQNGQQVMLSAKLTLYEARGDYQLIVENMAAAGAGALALAFEQLKAKLAQEGLFDSRHKKALPGLPRHIALISSPTGAAVHDILSVLRRRSPATRITLIPVAVQGKSAASGAAAAIALANQLQHDPQWAFDVILLARGGGSLEDLWAFNEELLARAIAASQLPLVSAIGHETDFSIADFVADVRAPTPSAAAELLSGDQQMLRRQLSQLQVRLYNQLQQALHTATLRLLGLRRQLRHPGHVIQEQMQRLDELELRLQHCWQRRHSDYCQRLRLLTLRLQQQSPVQRLPLARAQLGALQRRLSAAGRQRIRQHQARLHSLAQLLHGVSPLATLDRGYSILQRKDGSILRCSHAARDGEYLQATLADGKLRCRVER